MLLNSLENLQMKLEKCEIKLDEDQLTKLDETLKYHIDGLLPIPVLKRELKLSYEETHKLMIYLSTVKILKPIYKILCENYMMTGAGKEYEKLSEIPTKVCDRCERNCILLESVHVEFKVISCEY